MKRLIFLDIDGVLNSHKRSDEIGDQSVLPIGIDRTCLGLLKNFCEEIKASIIISSTWRKAHPSVNWFIGMFAAHGWYFPEAPIIGMTICSSSGYRGGEIDEYVSHIGNCDYVIFDDGCDFLPQHPLIHVDTRVGLQEHDIQKALKIFR